MICLNTKKLKSCTSFWHLLHPNSLRCPFNWVSSLTRWNSTAANLPMMPFMGPSWMLQGTSLHSLDQRHCSTHSLACNPWGSAKHAEYKTENHIVPEVTCRQQTITLKLNHILPLPGTAQNWQIQRCALKIKSFWAVPGRALSPLRSIGLCQQGHSTSTST